jgi:recombinational DNA repair protein (RecF pathway)
VDKTNKYDKQVFDFYKELLDLINKNEYSEEMQILAILKDFCLLSGLNFEVNHCVKCGSNKLKTISLTNHGMICNACFDSKTDRHYGLDVSKVFYYLFNNKLNELSKYIAELDFVIKLLKQYIDDNTGIKLNALNHY